MMYTPNPSRYETMQFDRCGNSGILLPKLAFGLWQNFGSGNTMDRMKELIFTAFDLGIVHLDLANNYGPVRGAAEENFGKILKDDLMPYRDELIITTKAGYDMWPGPYGNWGSRKYLTASLDQSLKRMGLDYVDIFYHHRPDYETPVEETAQALTDLVRSGKALYIGLSNYDNEQVKKILPILKENKTPCLINQNRYNLLERKVEDGFLDIMEEFGSGLISFSPLAQGMLTDKYLNGIPTDSRAAHQGTSIAERYINDKNRAKVSRLNDVANERGQSLAQMALQWVLRDRRVTAVLVGASRPEQLKENVKILDAPAFTEEELHSIDQILTDR
ncbi:MAG: L-glyceraldehyde 3-phosphate reductase [Clostridiaceae bacterium]|nr:L-glyceraldehyde 3-phosphate reductase [Clostridiaceae bacterium]